MYDFIAPAAVAPPAAVLGALVPGGGVIARLEVVPREAVLVRHRGKGRERRLVVRPQVDVRFYRPRRRRHHRLGIGEGSFPLRLVLVRDVEARATGHASEHGRYPERAPPSVS